MDGRVGRSGRLEWLCRTGVFLAFSSVLSLSAFYLIGSFPMFSQWCEFLLRGRIMVEGHFILLPIDYHTNFQEGPSSHRNRVYKYFI